nr:MAG TPA: hypothetical protein [Caudoviricetes sp.]
MGKKMGNIIIHIFLYITWYKKAAFNQAACLITAKTPDPKTESSKKGKVNGESNLYFKK